MIDEIVTSSGSGLWELPNVRDLTDAEADNLSTHIVANWIYHFRNHINEDGRALVLPLICHICRTHCKCVLYRPHIKPATRADCPAWHTYGKEMFVSILDNKPKVGRYHFPYFEETR